MNWFLTSWFLPHCLQAILGFWGSQIWKCNCFSKTLPASQWAPTAPFCSPMQALALRLLLTSKPLLPASIRAAEGRWLRKRKLQTQQPNWGVQTWSRSLQHSFHRYNFSHVVTYTQGKKAGCFPMLQNQVFGKQIKVKRAQKHVSTYPQPFLVPEGVLECKRFSNVLQRMDYS